MRKHCVFVQCLRIMVRNSLPEITTPSTHELREIWRSHPNDNTVRRLIVEIVRLRRQIEDAESYRKCIQQVWNEDPGGSHLVALYKLRVLLQDELRRY
ncbi:hypothetical protein [Burkholderia cenocepacia]|uniref:hypothetical protein n=1 Tax=Burkholderia cenocepacia TaxID=95486 RepID=UPI002B252B51|nr:hypothetical protein [Burkholderia cenocepacia]MEB2558804.1 hypothetical protein [Burkholderia cenocepacia]